MNNLQFLMQQQVNLEYAVMMLDYQSSRGLAAINSYLISLLCMTMLEYLSDFRLLFFFSYNDSSAR